MLKTALKTCISLFFAFSISANANCMDESKINISDTTYLLNLLTQNTDNSPFSINKNKYKSIINNSLAAHDTLQLAEAYYRLASIQQLQGDNNAALINMNKAYVLFSKTDNKLGIANCLNHFGSLYRYSGEYEKAIKHHAHALNLFNILNDTTGKILGLNNMGIVYRNLKNYTKAKDYYFKAVELGYKTNNNLLSTVYNSMGSFFWYQHNNDSALYYYRKALAFKPTNLQLKERHCAVLNNIGNVFRTMGELDSSIYYYRLSLIQSSRHGLNSLTSITLKNIGKSCKLKGNLGIAKTYFNSSLQLAKKSNLVKVIIEIYLMQSEIYQEQDNYKFSLEKYKKYSQLKDSIISDEQLGRITEMEVKYAIQQMEKEKVVLRNNIIEKDLRIKENRNYINRFIFITVLLIVVTAFFYLRYLTNKKLKKKLLLINEELEEKVLYRTKSLKHEIKEHKQTEKKLLKSKIKAEESDKLKSAFLYNISHEIRTPMNAIVGFSDLLGIEADKNGIQKKYIEFIKSNSNKLLTLIEDIIDLAKIESTQIILKIIPFNVYTLLTELETTFSILANTKGIALKLAVSDNNKLLAINTDPIRLNQILSNLLSNAIKFTNSGYVEYGYKTNTEDKVEFFVKDTGIGIPKEANEFIFERFRRIEDSQKKIYGGTGLGLSICKKLVELLNGKIWLESELNKGSTFYFTLPFSKPKINKKAV